MELSRPVNHCTIFPSMRRPKMFRLAFSLQLWVIKVCKQMRGSQRNKITNIHITRSLQSRKAQKIKYCIDSQSKMISHKLI